VNCSNKSDFYKDINELYYFTFDVQKNENYGNYIWYKECNNFLDMLLSYFSTDDSLKTDNLYKMPFLNYTISDDGLIRIFNWNINYNSSNEIFETIIQYKKYGKPYSVSLREKIVSVDFYDHPAADHEFYSILEIYNDTYLLLGQRNFNNIDEYSFVTVYFKKDDMIVPYYAFRNIYGDLEGDMSMVFFGNYLKRINYIGTDILDARFTIKIVYDLTAEIDFIFDEFTFVGNYEKLKEIIRISH
jgi:hypothetical protein